MKRIIVLCILIAGFAMLQAQTNAFQPSNPFGSLNFQSSLFNPSKLSMSHSMSFSTSMMNRTSAYQSMYTNHLQYTVNPKLKLNMNLNFVNYGTASWKSNMNVTGNKDNKNQIFPEFGLQYKPSDKFTIEFQYRQMAYPYGQDQNEFWRP